jgi:hypothetical protein
MFDALYRRKYYHLVIMTQNVEFYLFHLVSLRFDTNERRSICYRLPFYSTFITRSARCISDIYSIRNAKVLLLFSHTFEKSSKSTRKCCYLMCAELKSMTFCIVDVFDCLSVRMQQKYRQCQCLFSINTLMICKLQSTNEILHCN